MSDKSKVEIDGEHIRAMKCPICAQTRTDLDEYVEHLQTHQEWRLDDQSPAERILAKGRLGYALSSGSPLQNPEDPVAVSIDSKIASELRDALLEQVIGVDETQEWDEEYAFCERCQLERTDDSKDCLCVVRNKLRAEQRKALREFFGGSE